MLKSIPEIREILFLPGYSEAKSALIIQQPTLKSLLVIVEKVPSNPKPNIKENNMIDPEC